MTRWNRKSDDLEGELRMSRPEPPAHFIKSLSARIGEATHEQGRHAALRRGFAVAVTVTVFGALASFGGLSYAASGAAHGVKAVKTAVTSSQPRVAKETPAGNQYAEKKTTICHHAGPRQRVTITVANAALPAHLAHGDTIGRCS
jgi:hypothetical protein